MMKKFFIAYITASFLFNAVHDPVIYAQEVLLPSVGSMVNLSPKFDPLLVKGVKLFPENPFKFEFIVDTGEMNLTQEQIKDEGHKLSSYFLAALTTPEKDMWVNLSPYEKDRTIPTGFGDTEMGKELLAQDYILKQIMATAFYPERQLGKKFWQKVYTESAQKFGTTNIPMNSFNKVWILPNEAVIHENAKANTVFVVKSSMKVMLEEDYLSKLKNSVRVGLKPAQERTGYKPVSTRTLNIIREIIIPALEKEVNEGSHFAKLRQIYQALILASWYKKNLKDNVLSKAYVDQGKTLGVDTKDKVINQKIYQQYLKAYKKGAYSYIKEELDSSSGQMIPKKYFSGGMHMTIDTAQASVGQGEDFRANMAMLGQLKRLLRVVVLATTFLGGGTLYTTKTEASNSMQYYNTVKTGDIVGGEISTYGWKGRDLEFLEPFTANGDRFNPLAMTIASNIVPLNYYVMISINRLNADGSLTIVSLIAKNADRGKIEYFSPRESKAPKRVADLTRGVWEALMGKNVGPSTAQVSLWVLGPDKPAKLGIVEVEHFPRVVGGPRLDRLDSIEAFNRYKSLEDIFPLSDRLLNKANQLDDLVSMYPIKDFTDEDIGLSGDFVGDSADDQIDQFISPIHFDLVEYERRVSQQRLAFLGIMGLLLASFIHPLVSIEGKDRKNKQNPAEPQSSTDIPESKLAVSSKAPNRFVQIMRDGKKRNDIAKVRQLVEQLRLAQDLMVNSVDVNMEDFDSPMLLVVKEARRLDPDIGNIFRRVRQWLGRDDADKGYINFFIKNIDLLESEEMKKVKKLIEQFRLISQKDKVEVKGNLRLGLEEALKVYPDLERLLTRYRDSLDALNPERVFLRKLFFEIAEINYRLNRSRASNKGGIDLYGLNMLITGEKGGVKTAFTDPKILEVLQSAQGLQPIVQQVKPLPGIALDDYLGF